MVEFSVTRTHATWKPRITEEDVPLFVCSECGSIYAGITGPQSATYSGSGRSLVAEPPFLGMAAPSCCGKSMEEVAYIDSDDLPKGVEIDYRFEGGFNNNCLKVFWDIDDDERSLEWVLLKTFTGTQLKYALPGKRSPLLFAFADEDAFCYCDKNPCVECTFRCKKGMVAYAAIRNLGVVRMPLERMETPQPA